MSSAAFPANRFVEYLLNPLSFSLDVHFFRENQVLSRKVDSKASHLVCFEFQVIFVSFCNGG